MALNLYISENLEERGLSLLMLGFKDLYLASTLENISLSYGVESCLYLFIC